MIVGVVKYLFSWTSLSFFPLWIVANLLCSCLCLFYIIVNYMLWMKKEFND